MPASTCVERALLLCCVSVTCPSRGLNAPAVCVGSPRKSRTPAHSIHLYLPTAAGMRVLRCQDVVPHILGIDSFSSTNDPTRHQLVILTSGVMAWSLKIARNSLCSPRLG